MPRKLPLLSGSKAAYPGTSTCPVCRRAKVFEPHSFVVLEAGALLMNRRTQDSRPSASLDGFLSLIWHGAHDGGAGRDRDITAVLPVADSVAGGQVAFYFCSPKCLRQFFRELVTSLEDRIRSAKKPRARSRTPRRP